MLKELEQLSDTAVDLIFNNVNKKINNLYNNKVYIKIYKFLFLNNF